jgi:hypothetical protein
MRRRFGDHEDCATAVQARNERGIHKRSRGGVFADFVGARHDAEDSRADQQVGSTNGYPKAERRGDQASALLLSAVVFDHPSIALGNPSDFVIDPAINAPGLFTGTAAVSASALNSAGPGLLQPVGSGERMVIPFSFVGSSLDSNLQFTGNG